MEVSIKYLVDLEEVTKDTFIDRYKECMNNELFTRWYTNYHDLVIKELDKRIDWHESVPRGDSRRTVVGYTIFMTIRKEKI